MVFLILPLLILNSGVIIPNQSTKPTSKMASLFKNIKFTTKAIIAIIVTLISAIYGVLCSVFFTIIGKKHLAQWSTARFYYHFFGKTFGIKIKIDRPEILEKLPAILISNHQSELDVYLLGRLFPQSCVVTAKKQLKYVPFLGWFMSLSGTFFIDRSSRENTRRTLDNALQELKTKKGGLYMFAEGTRSYATKPTLLDFKKGAFHLAVQAGIPIIPICISNTSSLYSPKLKNFNTGTINVKVLDPIETSNLTTEDVSKLTEDTRNKMEKVIMELGMSPLDGETSSFPEPSTPSIVPASEATSSTGHSSPSVVVEEENVGESTSLLSGSPNKN